MLADWLGLHSDKANAKDNPDNAKCISEVNSQAKIVLRKAGYSKFNIMTVTSCSKGRPIRFRPCQY